LLNLNEFVAYVLPSVVLQRYFSGRFDKVSKGENLSR